MIFFIRCNNNYKLQQNKNAFSLKINSVLKVNEDSIKYLDLDKGHIYIIDILFENNTDSTIHFLIHNCAWGDNFITNSKNVYLFANFSCLRDFLEIAEIGKHQSHHLKGYIKIGNTSDISNNLKVGFIYVKPNEKDRIIEIVPPDLRDSVKVKKHNTHKNVIWSDYFKVK